MKPLFCCLCFIYSFSLFPQNPDSLLLALKNAQTDTARISTNCDLGLYWSYRDIDKADQYATAAIQLAETSLFPEYKVKAYQCKGSIYFCRSEFRESIEMSRKAVALTGNEVTKALSYLDMSIAFASEAYNDSFFVYAIEAAKIFEKYHDDRRLGKSYGNIGLVCIKMGKTKDAKKYLRSGIEISKRIGDKITYARNLQNLGVVYENTAEYDSALYYYSRALEIKTEMADSNAMITAYMGIANVSLEKNDIKSFNRYMHKAIQLAYQLKDMDSYSESLGSLAGGFYEQGQTDSAIYYYKKAIGIAIPIRYLAFVSDAYGYLAVCSASKGDFKSAYGYQKLFSAYKDSVVSENSNKQVETIKTAYETEKKEKENQLLQVQNELASETIKAQNRVTYFIIAGLLIAVAAALFIYKGYRQKKKVNTALEQKNLLIEQQKVETEKQKQIIEEHQKEIVDSINYAKRIQYSLLAHADLLIEHLPEHFVLFKPKDIVSGDFYWATEHQNRFYLAVCDSTGHGVPGAFMSLLNMNFLSEAIKEKNITEPHEILNHVRRCLIETVSKEGQQDGMDAILLCVNRKENTITYAAANNAPALIRGHKLIELEKDKMPVGKGERTESFTRHHVDFVKGDVLYLYTDGFADQFGGPSGKKFKYRQLNDFLAGQSSAAMELQRQALLSTFENWRGNLEQVDDVCIIGIRL